MVKFLADLGSSRLGESVDPKLVFEEKYESWQKLRLKVVVLPPALTYTYENQGWQVVAKSGLNHWFLPVKTGWQKCGWQKVAKNKINLVTKSFIFLV